VPTEVGLLPTHGSKDAFLPHIIIIINRFICKILPVELITNYLNTVNNYLLRGLAKLLTCYTMYYLVFL